MSCLRIKEDSIIVSVAKHTCNSGYINCLVVTHCSYVIVNKYGNLLVKRNLTTQSCFVLFQEGEIWPNSQAEINIIFKPQNAQRYYSLTIKLLELFPTDIMISELTQQVRRAKKTVNLV